MSQSTQSEASWDGHDLLGRFRRQGGAVGQLHGQVPDQKGSELWELYKRKGRRGF